MSQPASCLARWRAPRRISEVLQVAHLPKKKAVESITEFKAKARVHSGMALNVLVGIARQPDCPPAARVAAAIHILDRGWGKPEQTVVGAGDNGEITLVLRQIVEVPMKIIEHETYQSSDNFALDDKASLKKSD